MYGNRNYCLQFQSVAARFEACTPWASNVLHVLELLVTALCHTPAARYCPTTYTFFLLLPYGLYLLLVTALRPTLAARCCPTPYTCCSLLSYDLQLLLVTALRPTADIPYCPSAAARYCPTTTVAIRHCPTTNSCSSLNAALRPPVKLLTPDEWSTITAYYYRFLVYSHRCLPHTDNRYKTSISRRCSL